MESLSSIGSSTPLGLVLPKMMVIRGAWKEQMDFYSIPQFVDRCRSGKNDCDERRACL